MKILVTGGAGYIGSHFVKTATKAGNEVVVYDNLSTGHKKFVKFGPFVEGDICDTDTLAKSLKDHRIEAVVHFAARALVGESMEHPELYFSNNAWGTASVFEAMTRAGVSKTVYSSSCATYGLAQTEKIREDHPQNPTNPYGLSKLQGEQVLRDYVRLKKFRAGVLRYFNVVGQDPDGELWEDHTPETHIVPNILKAIETGKEFSIFGTNYKTPDGTAIRDYVHVCDLAQVHLDALEKLDSQDLLVSNVGSGRGYSVREVLKIVSETAGKNPKVVEKPRRPGDPDRLVADATHFQTWSKLSKRYAVPFA